MEQRSRDRLARHAAGALVWIAAFAYAVSFFLAATKLLRGLPPTEPLAIGRVTLEGVSKARDYAAAALYYGLVPIIAFVARPLLARYHARLAPRAIRGERLVFSTFLFAIPFILAPFLFLTTRKELWGILLPVVLAAAGPLSLALGERRRWARALFAPSSAPIHALLLAEAGAWVLFRYLAAGTRIAHIPTLFLEIPFVLFFLVLFWAAAMLVARAWALSSFGTLEGNASSIAIAASPLLVLPLLPLVELDLRFWVTLVWAVVAIAAVLLLAFRRHDRREPARMRRAVAWIAIPILLFVIGWTSIANSLKWIDVFHRGESLGPAAEYLAGEVPYKDVFILHGLMDDGMLDAWLMRWAGADVAVSNTRIVAMSAMAMVALWLLAFLLFDSIPLALLVVALGAMTFVENARALLELSVLALLFAGVWWRRPPVILAAGAVSALTLFYSLDIGLYSIFGSVAGLIGWFFWTRRVPADQRSTINDPRSTINEQRSTIPWYLAGLLAGAAPFLIWLASAGALGDFFRVSFVDVPRFIDPVWSLPFPDLASFFRSDLQIRSIADFLLGERSRYLLNPLVLGAALLTLVARFARRLAPGKIDLALLLLATFGIFTQRSALGRADFPHQYFSAFLIAPTLVALLVILVRAWARVWREEGSGGRLFLATLALLSIPILGGVLWIPDLVAARLDSIVYFRAQRSPAWHDPNVATVSDRIDAVSA
ncbi:MAG TPA: hypothetical protein VFV54_00240, partial [Thermoanaerobaculia bacterium]|nr:hypothetical protein [Thermoanaerobaculia bacterium]